MFPILLFVLIFSVIPSFCENHETSVNGHFASTQSQSNTTTGVNENFLYPSTSSRFKSYHFTLTDGYCQPDNYRQRCFLINGQFPGPPVFVNQYDLLQITVVNRLQVPTSIHFHGLLQAQTLDADGVPYVTQDPIQPNQTYIYRMQINGQTGTYMYHGHFDLDLIWLHGPFIVRDNPSYWKALGAPYQYDAGHEHVFQLQAIFHQPLEQLVREIIEDGNDDPDISSLAINGLSYGNWTGQNASSYGSGNAPGYEVVTVVPGKRYRFRIINISMGSYFRFSIANHDLTVIEADGILIDPIVTPHLEINAGQRYSVLVTMKNNVDNYWISSQLMESADEGGPANGKAILHYAGASNPDSLRKQLFPGETPGLEPTFGNSILPKVRPNRNYIDNQVYPLPKKANHTIFIDMHFRTTDGPPRFLINGHQFRQPNETYLTRVRNGEDISVGDPHVFKIKEGDIIDMVFQNRVDDTGGCDEHPIHLHGHTFWVLLSGKNTVNMTTLPGQLENASKNEHLEFRDVFTLFPDQIPENATSGLGCGWSVIRFTANNPGLWLVHCHITSHMMLGKMFTLYEVNPRNLNLENE